MASFHSRALLSVFAGATAVSAHGFVQNWVIDGDSYEGYNAPAMQNANPTPTLAAWFTKQTDLGFVDPTTYTTPDIICHKSATNGLGHAIIKAGDKIFIQWNTWPDSHKGPVMDYLAPCDDSCETVDKTTLQFFKIDEGGFLNNSGNGGMWASDTLIANNNSWMVEIPPTIKGGNYVLRHEIIALHSAGSEDGAQNYPQCFNLQITGGGSSSPSGTLGTKLYNANDPGILINIYTSLSTYTIPGPTLIADAVSVAQVSSAITQSVSAIQGSGTVPPAASPTGSNSGSGSGSNSGGSDSTNTGNGLGPPKSTNVNSLGGAGQLTSSGKMPYSPEISLHSPSCWRLHKFPSRYLTRGTARASISSPVLELQTSAGICRPLYSHYISVTWCFVRVCLLTNHL